MLTEEEKDILREEKAWAWENIIFLHSKLNHIIEKKNHYESGLDHWKGRFKRADRKLAFDEKLQKIETKKDLTPLAKILRDPDKAKALMELLRLAKEEVEEEKDAETKT